ncbi:MAG TPA: hypothetical protein VFZ78_08985 [Flavisolibacter sp.]
MRIALVMLLMFVVAGCNDRSTSAESKIDSIGKKFDSTAERVWDSTKEKAKDIRDRIENRFDKKDSVQKADTITH